MRFHIFGLANIPTCKENTYEPFTPLTWNMCKMLHDHGHHVTFYGCEGSDAPCNEQVNLVPGMPLEYKNGAPTQAWLNYRDAPRWNQFVTMGRIALRKRYRVGDISLMSFGNYQRFVAEESHLHCEMLCGYSGIFSSYKVFPSRAWMHYLYGQLNMECSPNWYDCVIPHYLDLDDFPFSNDKEDYLLFMGRLCKEKGPDIAVDIATRAGMKIYVAGVDHVTNTIPDWLPRLPNIHYLGYLDPEARLAAMRHARALIHPCRYIEPFGMVAIEALACGTPVIASDWGGLPEIIDEGVTGFCCRDMGEFLQAVSQIPTIDPMNCRRAAERKHTLDAAYPAYMRYFTRLQRTLGEGWYETQGVWRGTELVQRVSHLGNGQLRGAEIGVDRGWLSSHLLRELPTLHLDMIDLWKPPDPDSSYARSGDEVATRSRERRLADRQEAERVVAEAKGRYRIVSADEQHAAEKVVDGSLDFVFLDADHSREGTKAAIEHWAKKVRKGGLICGHDYNHSGYPQWQVAEAVDEYAKKTNQTVQLGADWTWFLASK